MKPRPPPPEPRSVAYVTTAFPTFAWFLENEVAWLRARGFRVCVLALRSVGEALHPEHAELVPLTRAVGSPWSPRSWWALLTWLVKRPTFLIPEVARILRASLRSPYALAGHLGYLPAAARVATIVEREGYARVHGAWAHFPGTVAYLAAGLTRRRFSMAAHAGADLGRTRAFLAEKARAADFVLTCVRANARSLADLAGPRANVTCVYHGVDLGKFEGPSGTRSAQPFLVAGGRLAPEKGLDLALRALAELKSRGVSARLALIGEGPSRGALASLAHELGISAQVNFTGRVPRADVIDLYRRAWVHVSSCRELPNGRRDGIPNVIVEAMAMGVPCVGTSVGGTGEIVLHGRTGLLCPPDDSQALASCIERLIRSREERDRMGGAARALVEEAFDAHRNFAQVLELFERPMVPTAADRATREGGDAPPHARQAPGRAPQRRPGKPVRVMHVMEAMSLGGAETMVVEHVRHAGPGFEVSVCALNGGGHALEQARTLGARVFDLSDRRRPGVAGRMRRLIRLILLLHRERIRVVNAHNPTGALYGVVAARCAGVPVVVRTEHSIHDPSRHSRFYLLVEPLLTACSDHVICVADAVLESHARRLRRWRNRFVAVQNGISDARPTRSRAAVRDSLDLGAEDRVILTVGSLTPQKAQHVLIEAFATVVRDLPRARLLIAGEGPLEGALRDQAARLGLDGEVFFLGARADVVDLLEAADVFALSSIREGMPVTALEAIRAGRPVVTSDAGGVRQIITDGECGLIVPRGDPRALADALRRLAGDVRGAAAMGERARRRWLERSRSERMVAETEAFYREA